MDAHLVQEQFTIHRVEHLGRVSERNVFILELGFIGEIPQLEVGIWAVVRMTV